jgi:hypothetical protein
LSGHLARRADCFRDVGGGRDVTVVGRRGRSPRRSRSASNAGNTASHVAAVAEPSRSTGLARLPPPESPPDRATPSRRTTGQLGPAPSRVGTPECRVRAAFVTTATRPPRGKDWVERAPLRRAVPQASGAEHAGPRRARRRLCPTRKSGRESRQQALASGSSASQQSPVSRATRRRRGRTSRIPERFRKQDQVAPLVLLPVLE